MTRDEFLAKFEETAKEVKENYATLSFKERSGSIKAQSKRVQKIRGEHGIWAFGRSIHIARFNMTEEEARTFARDNEDMIALHPDRHRHAEAFSLRQSFVESQRREEIEKMRQERSE